MKIRPKPTQKPHIHIPTSAKTFQKYNPMKEKVSPNPNFSKDIEHETIEKWETQKTRHVQANWETKKVGKNGPTKNKDYRYFTQLPKNEQIWLKHTNHGRYRKFKTYNHKKILEEVERVKFENEKRFGSKSYGVYKNSYNNDKSVLENNKRYNPDYYFSTGWSWMYVRLGIWASGYLGIWAPGHLVFWASGHLGIWASGHLGF